MFRRSFNSAVKVLGRRLYSKCQNTGQGAAAGGKDNLSVVLHGIKDMRMEQRPIPKIKEHQVLLQMESVGICGSDVHYYTEGRVGPYVVKAPMVIGHEASGTVVEAGKKVKHLKVGDRVAIEPGFGCRMCNYCKDGRYHLCPHMVFCATPPDHGNLSRFFAHDADFCFKLPDHVSLDEGALVEPLAVAVHSCKRANVKFGDVVLVMGAGPIGLVSAVAAKAIGASAVLVTDVMDFRLQKAKEFGADCVYKMKPKMPDQESIKEIKKTLGEDPDVCLECSGAEQAIRLCLQVAKTGGMVVLVGMDKTEMMTPLTSAIFREVDIRGIFRYCNDYPMALEMVQSGKANLKPLITHHFKLEESIKAFQTAEKREGNPIKIMIHANPKWQPSC